MNSALMNSEGVTLDAVIYAETPEPTSTTTTPPEDQLRPGLKDTDVSPGLPGFLTIFLITAVAVLLFLSMAGKLRKVAHKDNATNRVTATFDGPGPQRRQSTNSAGVLGDVSVSVGDSVSSTDSDLPTENPSGSGAESGTSDAVDNSPSNGKNDDVQRD